MKTIFERRKIYKKLLNDILTDEIYCKFGILYTGLCRMLRPNNPDCPKCGMRMVKRISKYGTFYGCSQYPNCKSTKSI